ncbi:MAG TPA: nicotinate (nicotinamide) nucleotide adenylyltransferase [Erysipelotrichaceae bacterium]|nr:nicotinate (nicotinamide) nucleotide adenylyltransferase [Erysipelotrichaceae bacterium]
MRGQYACRSRAYSRPHIHPLPPQQGKQAGPEKMKKVALLGGSFDPIHQGHIAMAREALRQIGADEVWFIPTYQTPLKDRILTSDTHRTEMIRLAIEGEPRFRLETIELERKEKSYTIDTLRELKEKYPDIRFYYLIGSDQMEQFDKWRDVDELMQLAEFVGIERENTFGSNPCHLRCMNMEQVPVSSSKIRKGDCLQYVDEKVLDYIYKNRLYVLDFVRSRVHEHRFLHSCSVADLCELFALENGYDPDKAYLTGLFHDVAKELDPRQMKAWMKKIAPEYMDAHPAIFHGFVGGQVVRSVFRLDDPQISNAIHWHVLGLSADPYAMMVYCADKLDPTRGYDSSGLIEQCKKDIYKGFELTKAQNDKYITEKENK